MNRNLQVGGILLLLLAALGAALAVVERVDARQGGVQAPRFEVDPMWPRPLPNH